MEERTTAPTQKNTLTQGVPSVLQSPDTLDVYEEILRRGGDDYPDDAELAYLVMDLVDEKLGASEFIAAIRSSFGYSEEVARRVAVQVGEQVLAPLDARLPFPVSEHVRFWNGETDQEVLDPTRYVHSYVASLAGASDPHFSRRLEGVLRRYLFTEFSREEALAHLMGKNKLDGLGLDGDVAEQVLMRFDEDRASKTIGHAPSGASEVIASDEGPLEDSDVKEFEMIEEVEVLPEEEADAGDELPPADLPISDAQVDPIEQLHEEAVVDARARADIPPMALPVSDGYVDPIEALHEEQMRASEGERQEPSVQDVVKEVAQDEHQMQERPTTLTSVPTDFSEEEAEAAQHAQEKAHVVAESGPLDIPQIVQEICANPAFEFDDDQLRTRCEKAVESRVREVRGPQETRAQLEKAVAHGGLGVSGRRLADMLQAIEQSVERYQSEVAQQHADDRQAKKDARRSKEDHAHKEAQILSKRYAELTGQMPSERVAPASPSVARTSAAISAHHEQLQREGRIDVEKVKEVVRGASEAESTQPRVAPTMQEVTFAKRLSGPVDELRTMTLIDFRRLSKDVKQAATKVKDKVDLLEDQGYEKRVEAIEAWRESPLNQMYVSLTRNAVLQGTPVSELLIRQRQAGEDTLSDDELRAVMELNAALRF